MRVRICAFRLHAEMQLVVIARLLARNCVIWSVCRAAHAEYGIRFCVFVMQIRAHPNSKQKANGRMVTMERSQKFDTLLIQSHSEIYAQSNHKHTKLKRNGMKWPNSVCSGIVCIFLKWQFTNSLECWKLRNKWIIIRCRQFFFCFRL